MRDGEPQREGERRGDNAGDDDNTAREKISEKKGDDSHGEDVPYDAPRPLLAVPGRGHVPVGTTRKLWSGPTYMSLQIPKICGLITYNEQRPLSVNASAYATDKRADYILVCARLI